MSFNMSRKAADVLLWDITMGTVDGLLVIAIEASENLPKRIPKSSTLQNTFKDLAKRLATWRADLPFEKQYIEFLLLPAAEDKHLYRKIFKAVSEIIFHLARLYSTFESCGRPSRDLTTHLLRALKNIERTAAEVDVVLPSKQGWDSNPSGPDAKDEQAPYAVLFDDTARKEPRYLERAEKTIKEHVQACYQQLSELSGGIERAYKRREGLQFLSGKGDNDPA